MEDIPNTPQKLATRFEELKAAYKGSITLHLAAEYMIDNNLHKLLKAREGVEKDCSCHSDHTLTNKSKEVLGAVQSKPFQETPPRFRGEVVEDRRGEKKTTDCLMRHELSEVTEGNQTNNCPSYVRGTSNTNVAEGVDITNPQEINSLSLQRGAVRNNSTACDDGGFSTPKESPLGLTKGEGVETNKLLPIGTAGKHIFVETSYFTPPMRLHETLRKIKSLGYYPILAHPERYMYMEKEEYLELHEEGIKFQLNLASLAGGYGKAVKKKAEWLLKKELYSIAGSDLHCEDAIEFITGCKLGEKEMETLKIILKNTI
jgi:hypothetical protein